MCLIIFQHYIIKFSMLFINISYYFSTNYKRDRLNLKYNLSQIYLCVLKREGSLSFVYLYINIFQQYMLYYSIIFINYLPTNYNKLYLGAAPNLLKCLE